MEQTLSMAVPGQTFTITARLYNRSNIAIAPGEFSVNVPQGWTAALVTAANKLKKTISPGDDDAVQFKISVPENAAYTKPYFWRTNPETETVYNLSQPQYLTLPWAPYPVHAAANFSVNGETSSATGVAKIKFVDPALGQSERPLAVGPPVSVLLTTPVIVAPVGVPKQSLVEVNLRSNVPDPVHATLHLDTPKGWTVQPESIPVSLDHDGDVNNYSFRITPQDLHEGTYKVTAKVEYNGKEYAEGFKIITRPDLDSYYAYHPATENVQAVDVSLPPKLKVGYIMGTGDEIPAVLRGLGIDINLISPQELTSGDLTRYDTIVVGIRAYDVRTDVREENRRLLDYANRGGTLIVQYNQSTGIFNDGHYTPYPATLGRERVSVEEQPVEILAPADRVFSYPNKITEKDFDGWVQERGIYFMSEWDSRFKPLLACNDPGEPTQKGGLLLAQYGKGIYIYTGYAFFRQLPAGVPGAVRLMVNLLSAGH
jgi:hypothetical protein